MSQELNKSLGHFLSSQASHVIKAGSAVSKGAWSELADIIDRVSKSKIVESITNLVNSSADALKSLQTQTKFLSGVVAMGMGGVILAEVAGVAAALGLSVMSTGVIACLLILWGISRAFPTLWTMALQKLKDSQGEWMKAF